MAATSTKRIRKKYQQHFQLTQNACRVVRYFRHVYILCLPNCTSASTIGTYPGEFFGGRDEIVIFELAIDLDKL